MLTTYICLKVNSLVFCLFVYSKITDKYCCNSNIQLKKLHNFGTIKDLKIVNRSNCPQ